MELLRGVPGPRSVVLIKCDIKDYFVSGMHSEWVATAGRNYDSRIRLPTCHLLDNILGCQLLKV